jgi:hypothetical protein
VRRFCTISVLTMGCWTSSSGPPSSVGPSERTPVARDRVSQLEEQLRDPDDSMFVDRFVEGQLVIFERETGTIQILCEAQTLTASVRFSELLNDPDRPRATCSAARPGHVICTQGTGAALLWLDFQRIDDAWRLVGGIPPRGPVPPTGDFRALIREYRAKLSVAACPP